MISIVKKYILKEDNFFFKQFLSPISNIKSDKNYKKLFTYYIMNKEASFSSFKYAIYFDNEDPAAVLQIDKWFSHNFFKKEETLILFRIYSSSLSRHINFLEKNNYNFYAFRVLRYFDVNKSHIQYIFYPFNSFTNPVIIKNRSIKHIWIAHGESDKLASVNPMIGMYDFIFTSGDIAVKRLLKFKIINTCDIENKIIKIGMPYLAKPLGKSKRIGKKKKILYAPTWEGVEKEQQYSSLENSFGLDVIKRINQIYEGFELYFMPHPSTGIKNHRYIDYVKDIIIENKNNDNFFFVQNKNSYIYQYTSHMVNKNKYFTSLDSFENFDLVISDISSITANLVYYKVNYIVLLKDLIINNYLNTDSTLMEDMPLLSISSIVDENRQVNLESIIDNEYIASKQNRFDRLVSYESIDENNQTLDFYINKIKGLA